MKFPFVTSNCYYVLRVLTYWY